MRRKTTFSLVRCASLLICAAALLMPSTARPKQRAPIPKSYIFLAQASAATMGAWTGRRRMRRTTMIMSLFYTAKRCSMLTSMLERKPRRLSSLTLQATWSITGRRRFR